MTPIRKNRLPLLVLIVTAIALFSAGCTRDSSGQLPNESSVLPENTITFSGSGVRHKTMTLEELKQLPGAQYEHVYSAVNNWPTRKKFAARGVKLTELFKAAGVPDNAQWFTFKAADHYNCSLTREQLFETDRFYFPGVMDGDAAGAEPVEPILAYEYAENSDRLSAMKPDKLMLIIPQATVDEQNNPTFVKGVNEIVVSTDDPGKWEAPTPFPFSGKIPKGETVKLQHKHMDNVKMYYTLDGSTPTEESKLYNISAYQLELNKPIVINKDTTIKVLVKGFGKHNSDIAAFDYQVQ